MSLLMTWELQIKKWLNYVTLAILEGKNKCPKNVLTP